MQDVAMNSAKGSWVPRTTKLRGDEGNDKSGRRDRRHLSDHAGNTEEGMGKLR